MSVMMRWDPLRELGDLQRSINQLFEGRHGGEGTFIGFPVDVYDTPHEVVVSADLPGLRAEDIQVQHHEGQLYIRAARSATLPEGATWLMHQTPDGEMMRAFTIGVPVDVDQVQATYEGGVLELHLPKSEHARPRAIPVRAASGSGGRRRSGEAKTDES